MSLKILRKNDFKKYDLKSRTKTLFLALQRKINFFKQQNFFRF
jgi:DNA-binding CsgD family transcriptional regulator